MAADTPVFEVPWLSAFGSSLLERHGGMLEKLGLLETRFVQDQIAAIDTTQPIFVCGLARSGTTVLLELIAAHGDVASQRYLDFPFVFTPFLWNRYLGFARRAPAPLAERSHKDGLMVSPDSPEAMEEPLWMRFFPEAHDPTVSNVLDGSVRNEAFERFYDAHMAKLLLVRDRLRYAAKGNYHVARLQYLLRLYPNARFVIPVRDPVMHIASSMKQHALFCRGESNSAKARQYLQQVGHFEFGLDRRPINLDAARIGTVMELWDNGDEVGGWSHYWAMVHDHVAGLLERDAHLRDAVMVVGYEDFCREPHAASERISAFCGLGPDAVFDAYARERIKAQSYYEPDFSPKDVARMRDITGPAFERIARHVTS
jgi:hypothetical protein